MASGGRRKSDNYSLELCGKTRSNSVDKKVDTIEKMKVSGNSGLGKNLDGLVTRMYTIGKHYMVKRGDTWREYIF